MKLDPDSGQAIFATGAIAPGLTRSQFQDSVLGANARQVVENAGWLHLNFSPEPELHVGAIFKDDVLHQLFICMPIENDDIEHWTEAHELERKAVHDSWLRAELGDPPYVYPWGRIESDYDARGCASDIIVTYGG